MDEENKGFDFEDETTEEVNKGASGKKETVKKAGLFETVKSIFPKEKSRQDVLRAEDVRKRLENGEDVSTDEVISTYLPQRRAKLFGKALLRMDKMKLFLLLALVLVLILFIIAFMQEKMGNFTINLNRLELYRKGISMAADEDFTDPTARLKAEPVNDATNISIEDIPIDVDEIDGDHNGINYMAYTYYVRNAGKEDVGYQASITLTKCAKGAEKAVRVAVWRNGVRTVYAAPAKNGQPEEGCESFLSDTLVCSFTEEEFLIGNVDKYTVVIWMEGDDPECIDDIVGGSVEFVMKIDALADDDTSLFWKFVEDIRDTITGDKPINAAGIDSPDYYNTDNITWKTRRNQELPTL